MKCKGKKLKSRKCLLLREINSLCVMLLSRLRNIIAQVDELQELVYEEIDL